MTDTWTDEDDRMREAEASTFNGQMEVLRFRIDELVRVAKAAFLARFRERLDRG